MKPFDHTVDHTLKLRPEQINSKLPRDDFARPDVTPVFFRHYLSGTAQVNSSICRDKKGY